MRLRLPCPRNCMGSGISGKSEAMSSGRSRGAGSSARTPTEAPRSSTVASAGATFSIARITGSIAGSP